MPDILAIYQFAQLRASSTFTEPTTGQTLTVKQISQLEDSVALRTGIKDFFTFSAAELKVGMGCPSNMTGGILTGLGKK
jgi:hypothetical protein